MVMFVMGALQPTYNDRYMCMVNDVVTDAAHKCTPDLPHTACTCHDETRLLLIRDLTHDLPRAASNTLNSTADLKVNCNIYYSSLYYVNLFICGGGVVVI